MSAGKRITRVNTGPEARAKLDALTRREGVSISELVRRLIEAEYERVARGESVP